MQFPPNPQFSPSASMAAFTVGFNVNSNEYGCYETCNGSETGIVMAVEPTVQLTCAQTHSALSMRRTEQHTQPGGAGLSQGLEFPSQNAL